MNTSTILTSLVTVAASLAGVVIYRIGRDFIRAWQADRCMTGVAGYQTCEDGSPVYVAYHGYRAAAFRAARQAEERYGVRIVVK